MDHRLPYGFLFELAGNKAAMRHFSALFAEDRERVVSRARLCRTKSDMRILVDSLDRTIEAQEFY